MQRDIPPPDPLVVTLYLSEEKGGDLLRSVVAQLDDIAEFWLLGAGESGQPFTGMQRVHVIPSYQRDELAAQGRVPASSWGVWHSVPRFDARSLGARCAKL